MRSTAKSAYAYVPSSSDLGFVRPLHRVSAALQRDAGAVRLDGERRVVEIGSVQAHLKKTSFQLLAYLIGREGSWVGTAELRDNVLHAHFRVGASNVRWHVLQTRRALGAQAWCLHGCRRGYMFQLNECEARHCTRTLPPR